MNKLIQKIIKSIKEGRVDSSVIIIIIFSVCVVLVIAGIVSAVSNSQSTDSLQPSPSPSSEIQTNNISDQQVTPISSDVVSKPKTVVPKPIPKQVPVAQTIQSTSVVQPVTTADFVSPTPAKTGIKTQVLKGIYLTVSTPQDFTETNPYEQPQTGNKDISINVSFDNETQDSIYYNIYSFSVTDPSGGKYQHTCCANDPALSDGTINQRNLASGNIVFEVPATTPTSQFTVHYESSGYPQAVVDFLPTPGSVQTTTVTNSVTVPTQPTTLTDQQYAQQLTQNVTPFLNAMMSDIPSGSSILLNPTDALANLKQAQSNITLAQNGMQALQSKVPTDYTNVNTLMNESISSYSVAISLMITAINNKDFNLISSANTNLNQGNLYITQITADMSQINAQNGI